MSERGGYPAVVVRRVLPTDPAVRGSASLFVTEAERQGLRADRRMLYIGPEPAEAAVAAALRVATGVPVIARRKLLIANEVPVRIATSYFRADLFGDTRIAKPGFVKPTLQTEIETLGYRFGRAAETLTARAPSETEVTTLELAPGEWVVEVLRASYSVQDEPIHVLQTVCAGSRHVFEITQIAGADEF
jgi:GntR family transcriptional regulator